jgi:hypothetical protein
MSNVSVMATHPICSFGQDALPLLVLTLPAHARGVVRQKFSATAAEAGVPVDAN